jgi:membrane peptidoglycan carboxypeptidase
MDKIQILRSYLLEVYLGSHIYGVRRGARVIFDKEIFELRRAEAAFLAAMMVYPRPLRPTAAWKSKVDARASYALRLFDKLGRKYRRNLER